MWETDRPTVGKRRDKRRPDLKLSDSDGLHSHGLHSHNAFLDSLTTCGIRTTGSERTGWSEEVFVPNLSTGIVSERERYSRKGSDDRL